MFKLSGKTLSPLIGLDFAFPTPPPCTEQDVRTVLGKFTPTDLNRLDQAFDQGKVLRRTFSSGSGQGCLLYHLDNSIVSFTRQLRFFAGDTAAYEASQKLIAAWDSEKLTEPEMRRMLSAEIEARATAHASPRSWTSRWVGKLTDVVADQIAKTKSDAPAVNGPAPAKAETAKKTNRKPATVPAHEPSAV